MIEVRHLTKRYGGHTAVSDLSFTIEKGVIYGFLGPNGAGKSTTMNIITGCLGASEGEVLVGGHSIMDEPMAAKRLIGYLPEQPPLYTDMTVDEYLRFVVQAKGVRRSEWGQQVEEVVNRTGLKEVRSRLIRNLSKGFRQRVGIAQALLGSPEVIILDEPTVGLDPAQIIEIRELIRDLGRTHTVVLSSHILSEVQAVCDAIMIISHGHLVASDTPENLTALLAGSDTLKLEALGSEERVRQVLSELSLQEKAVLTPGEQHTQRVELPIPDGEDIRERVFRAFAAADVPLLEMSRTRATLEDVFLELTSGEEKPDGDVPSGQTEKSGEEKAS